MGPELASLRRAVAVLALLAVGLGCGACSSTLAQLPYVGEPAGVPARDSQQATNYPGVHDTPPPRPQPMLEPTEQARLRADLTATRDKQAAYAAQQAAAAADPAPPAPPPVAVKPKPKPKKKLAARKPKPAPAAAN